MEYEVVWCGDKRAPHGGMLRCAPETPASSLAVDAECFRERDRRGERPGAAEGFTQRCYRLLAEKPRTIRELARAGGWTHSTATNAIYELNRKMGHVVQSKPMPHAGKGRHPRMYWVKETS